VIPWLQALQYNQPSVRTSRGASSVVNGRQLACWRSRGSTAVARGRWAGGGGCAVDVAVVAEVRSLSSPPHVCPLCKHWRSYRHILLANSPPPMGFSFFPTRLSLPPGSTPVRFLLSFHHGILMGFSAFLSEPCSLHGIYLFCPFSFRSPWPASAAGCAGGGLVDALALA
jgi:hypothetical protein